jgi:hypothetical protein
MNPIHTAPHKKILHTIQGGASFIKTHKKIWWWKFLGCFAFPEEFYTLWWNLLLDQYGVSVLLKIAQTLTSMGYRFDMSISNRFCELVQDQTQPVHSVNAFSYLHHPHWGQIVDGTQSWLL